MNYQLLMESDELLYRSAFAVERTLHQIITKNGSVRAFDIGVTKTEIKKKLSLIGKVEGEDYTIDTSKVVEEVSHAIQIVKRQIQKLKAIRGIDELRLFISPSDGSNFRFGVAKTPGPKGLGYKAGRPPKPTHYQAIRDYLINVHGAEEALGCEADDMLSIGLSSGEGFVASHIDKDIAMVPGKHLNWVTGERYIVPEGIGILKFENKKIEGRGLIFFYHQMLTGDAVDNIPGIKGVGVKKAFDLLHGVKNEQEAFDIISKLYYNQYNSKAKEVIGEIASLLWMLRKDRLTGEQYLVSRGFL